MKALATILAALIVIPALAEEAPEAPMQAERQPRPRLVPPSGSMAPRQERGQAEALDKNITIRIYGKLPGGEVIDLSLTGVGRVFSTDSLIGEENTVVRCEYLVEPEGAAYRVNYSIGSRIKVSVQGNGDTAKYEYRDVTTNGTVLCQEGKTVGIYKGRDGGLFLSVGDAVEERPE